MCDKRKKDDLRSAEPEKQKSRMSQIIAESKRWKAFPEDLVRGDGAGVDVVEAADVLGPGDVLKHFGD